MHLGTGNDNERTAGSDAVLRAITDEVVKSSDIEGERLGAGQVRSSVARRLGLEADGLKCVDRLCRFASRS